MRVLKVSTGSLAVSFILGCAPGSSPEPPPPTKTVFDPLTQQRDRAKDVQNTVDAQAEAQRKAVAAQERGDNPP